MNDNPYRAKEGEAIGETTVPLRKAIWSILVWAVIGFGLGTGLIAPTILSIDAWDRVIGGMLIGGTPLTLIGAVYGWWSARPLRPRSSSTRELRKTGV